MYLTRLLKPFRPRSNVHPHYNRYVMSTFLSNVLVSAQITLSTHNMLKSVSSCDTSYILSSNYIGKDICGQLGSLWYINKTSENADKKPLKFLNKSLLIQQASILTEFSTSSFSSTSFIYIAGVGNIGQNISAAGIGAVNAKLISNISNNNIGEIYAKLISLNTLGTSIGMGLGIMINMLTDNDENMRLCILIIFGILRYIIYNYGVKKIIN